MDRYQIQLGKPPPQPPPPPLPIPKSEDTKSGVGKITVTIQGKEYEAELHNYRVVSVALGVSRQADILINVNSHLTYKRDCDISIFNSVLNHTIQINAAGRDYYYLVQNVNSTYNYGVLHIGMSGIIQEQGIR